MPVDMNSILGAAPAAPAPAEAPVEEAPAPEAEPSIPDAVLEIPEFMGLLEGKPPAVSIAADAPTPESQTVMQNQQALADAGFGFYKSSDGSKNVIYNSQFVSPEQIAAADKKGKLDTLATPFAELQGAYQSATGGAPAAAAPVSAAVTAPQPASAQRAVTNARLKNVAPSSPTSGPVPGQGRILNGILKPTI